jgi:CelD/BcsL family acetyltransferase involved in cellulose biosynthesis
LNQSRACPPPEILFDRVTDPAGLGRRWRSLEAACDGGFFRSWTYLGTLLPHMAAPRLLAVRHLGTDVALALFNDQGAGRGKPRLALHEAGCEPWDGIYVEHNGLLHRPGAQALLPQALAAAAGQGAVVLSGIGAGHVQAARAAGEVQSRLVHFAPAVDLAALAAAGRSHLDTVSANARSQIRRAMRLYGPELTLAAAASTDEALHFFECLSTLHQAAWRARGKPGAFAQPAIRAFHATLIGTGFPRGEVALLRITAGVRPIGYLYQFQHGGAVLAYQSGFAPEHDARLKPGLVCHTMAIAHAMQSGAAKYDFLAGAQRYKTSLAPDGGETLHWVTLHHPASFYGRARRLWRAVGFDRSATSDAEQSRGGMSQ